MDSELFRAIFNRSGHILPVKMIGGGLDMAVGLNGESMVLHKGGTLPLAYFDADPIAGELREVYREMSEDPPHA